MPLANYSFSFNGFVIGNGTSYLVTDVEGLGGTSPLRIQDENRGYLDGSWSGHDFYDERTVYIDVTVLGDASTTAQANYKLLQNAFAPQPLGYYESVDVFANPANYLKLFQYRLNANTGDMRLYGRSRGIVTPIDANFTYGYIQCRIMLSFPDPRYYTDTGTTLTGTVISVVNNGWAISCPVINLVTTGTSGELTDGTLGSTVDGKTHMYFSNMAVTTNLSVDLLSRVIYMNFAPARNILTAASTGWLQSDANSSATWRSNIGTMSVVTRSAYV